MMYLKDSFCISPQKSFEGNGITEYTPHSEIKYVAQEPDYSQHIPNGILRRMGKSVRMGVGAGLSLIKKHPQLDGILMASSNGAIEDSFKFLNQMITYEEGTLTPTHFVQSTPNAPAGQLAMMSKATGYNITHVSTGLAFEASLIDAQMLFEEKAAKTLMIGAVEELSECHFVVHNKVNHFKKSPLDANELFKTDSAGSVYGEGAVSFIISDTATEGSVKIVDVAQMSRLNQEEIDERIAHFLKKNNISYNDIDGLVIGLSGDNRFDFRYAHVIENLFKEQAVFTYKNLVGEYPTSSAFATWMGAQLLIGNPIPKEAVYRTSNRPVNRILIYNQYYDQTHGLILMEK